MSDVMRVYLCTRFCCHNLIFIYVYFVVTTASEDLCRSSTFVKIVSNRGYLASSVSMETGCGSAASPWIIEAELGQRINLTLLDFTAFSIRLSSPYEIPETTASLGVCHDLLVIRDGTNDVRISNCEVRPRVSAVYTSTTNAIEVQILAHRGFGTQFLVQYEGEVVLLLRIL